MFEKIGRTDGETVNSSFDKDIADAFRNETGYGKDIADAFKREDEFGKDIAEAFKRNESLLDLAEGISHKELKPLSDEEKEQIKSETGWSDEVVDNIGSREEYEVYKDAGLEEKEINGKPCLVKKDIDLEQKDESSRTNEERMEQGLAPLDKNGKPVELHHIGQKSDSPLAELSQEEHRGKGNDSTLHDKTKDTEIDRVAFGKEKAEHWETRAQKA